MLDFHTNKIDNCARAETDQATGPDIEYKTEKTNLKFNAICQIALELDQSTASKYTDRRRKTKVVLFCIAVVALVLIWKLL